MQGKESTYLKITDDNRDIHIITLAALSGSAVLLTAVGFGICFMITVCVPCKEETKCFEIRVRSYEVYMMQES